MDDKNKARKVVTTKLLNFIKYESDYINNNEDISEDYKIAQLDILLDILKFVDDYDNNVKILNDYKANSKFQSNEER